MTVFRFFGRRKSGTDAGPGSKSMFTAPLSPDQPLCVIGDIHGCDRLLAKLLDRIDALPEAPRVVCVGDYVDRGDESREVIDRLIPRSLSEDFTCLMGNHEEMLLAFLDAPTENTSWVRYGGLQTLASFGVGGLGERPSPQAALTAADALRSAIGKDRIAWLRRRPLWVQSGNVGVVHAAADPTRPLEDQDPRHLTWGHRNFTSTLRGDGIWIVHGHVVTDEIEPHWGRIDVDTGAYATGRLSAALIRPDGSLETLTATY